MTKPCETYEEARAAYQDGKLQAWDGQRWMDIPPGQGVFFSREVFDYRRKPTPEHRIPEFMVWRADRAEGKRISLFGTAREVALHLWGCDLREAAVFKRTRIQSLDIKRIEEQLEKIH